MEREVSRPVVADGAVAAFVGRVGGRLRHTLRLVAIVSLGVTLAACGGGGGGDDSGGGGAAAVVGTGGTGNVTVTVTDEANAALAGANVSVTGGTVTKTGATAADGTVTLSDIPAGTASLSVTKDLYDTVSRNVTITRDATATSAVRLTRKTGTITGTVTDQFSTRRSRTPLLQRRSRARRSATGPRADGTVTINRVPTGVCRGHRDCCWLQGSGSAEPDRDRERHD